MGEGRIIADMTPAELLSSDLLVRNGIREPLYITALKYAGVSIDPAIGPQRIDTLKLSDEDIRKVHEWYSKVPMGKITEKAPVILAANGIGFDYSNGFRALDSVDMEVRKGEMISIVGKNGAGKSTFAKVICGFVKQKEGTVSLNGEDMAALSIKERADHIGYVMQNPNQMISKPMIREEVALGLVLRKKLTQAEIDAKVDETLKVCGLYPFRNWPVNALSYGQKKRVTIASILVMDPEVIILDEPTAGQDFRHYTDIMEFLRSLNGMGITIILITHDMHLMIEYCSRAVVLCDSHKVADMPCEEVLTDTAVVEKANLKETSLSRLASVCGIDDGQDFIRRFITADREAR